jgi:hypothetical protein
VARQLTAGPIVDASTDTTVFIPGPTAYPPLDPVANVERALLGSGVASSTPGTYPSSVTYPGSDVLPGKGSDLIEAAITPRVLTEVAA